LKSFLTWKKEARANVISRPLEIQYMEKAVNDSVQAIQDQVLMTKSAVENLASDDSNLQLKIEKKKVELERREKRLKSLQTVR
jgi:clusterin-associated protein 1